MKRKETGKIALTGLLCALAVVILYFGSVLEILDLTTAAVASFLVYFAVIELGGMYPWSLWLISSVLSIVLLPNKFGAAIFAVFAGVYPMFKLLFERNNAWISWILKMSMFDTALVLTLVLSKHFFAAQAEGMAIDIVFFVLGNITFVLYDLAMTKLLILYTVKIRSRLKIDRLFKK
ncbi:MAG: hypothetical protein E7623_02640 [Ruminococcaceae bacterium]|nr:hypothetical protein [Oscillospiraceae bacterium]